MDPRYFTIDARYARFRKSKVRRFRVVVHTLGRQDGNDWSKNYVVIWLLFGNDRAVMVDMRPSEEDVGIMWLNTKKYTNSLTCLAFYDIVACGCPESFSELTDDVKEDDALNRQQGVPTVQDCIDLIITRGLQRYFCIQRARKTLACRFWV